MSRERENDKINVSGSFRFCEALAILFIALKLMKVTVVASWSWWWVLAPIWIPTAFALGVLLIVCIVVGIAKVIG